MSRTRQPDSPIHRNTDGFTVHAHVQPVEGARWHTAVAPWAYRRSMAGAKSAALGALADLASRNAHVFVRIVGQRRGQRRLSQTWSV